MRILVAEDDPISRLMLQATLKKWGHEPVVSCDGREAIAILEQDSPPQVAILDWMMPEMDGLEVCRHIRSKQAELPIYIILLTAKAQREDLVKGLEAGADDYIRKPFNHQELYARLQTGIRITDLQRKLAGRVQELEVALMRLRRLQQEQKLEALGRLAAGIAHEMNTPLQYIGDNVRFLKDSCAQLRPLIEKETDPEACYLVREVPNAIDESLEGIQRVSKIVWAMRDFAHPQRENKVRADINHAIETTITVATNEWKYVANVEKDLDPELPAVMCFPGEIQQVLLNLIVNAAHAIASTSQSQHDKGLIRVTTASFEDWVEIRVSDTGAGIREEHRSKIFEPFFTTKDAGVGTGQGLAIAYSVVVQQHDGKIWFETETGRGTTFFIQLPADGVGQGGGRHEEANSICRR